MLTEKQKKENEDSDSEAEERKKVDQGICHSPIQMRQPIQNIEYPETLVKEMSATQTTQATLLQTMEQLTQALQGAGGKRRKAPPTGGAAPPTGGSGGRPPTPGSGGGGGGPPPA